MNKTNLVSTDPIADMLSRVRNAVAVNKNEVSMPHSNLKETVAKILADNGFLSAIEINELNSRPGRRLYVKSAAIPTVKRGRGLVVISTSKGIMTGKQAANQKLGGELICEVY